jgi:putative Mg2+ transporter-C (MgtC) family protein
MPSNLELLGRLLLAAVLGAGLGADQELRGQPAGMRTHTLLAIGACLFTLVSAYGFGGSADPSRLAAQVIAGLASSVVASLSDRG